MGALTFEQVLDKYGYTSKKELEKVQAEVEQLRAQVAENAQLRAEISELKAKFGSNS